MNKFLRSALFARILAVFLALILWLFVAGDNITRTTPTRKVFQGVPLQVENLGNNLVVKEIPATVDITLEGLAAAFDGLMVSELEAYLDLTDRSAGRQQVKVRGKPPRGLTLIAFSPEQVSVVIEPVVLESLPVEIEIDGTPAAEWKVSQFQASPGQVAVRAPQSVFELVSRVVVRVNVTGAQGTHRQDVAPVILDAQGLEITGPQVQPEKVAVTVVLVKEEEKKENEPGGSGRN